MSRTAPQSTSNALTPSFASVSSSAGFQAGDLIYAKDNTYGPIPNGVVASATFPISTTQDAARTPYNQTVVSVMEDSANTLGNNGRGPGAALLSNGNIVLVGTQQYAYYSSAVARAFYKIVDQNFTTVVSATQIGGTQVEAAGASSVAALTGGGFVVVFCANTSAPQYAVFSNTGSITLASTAIPGFSNSSGVTCASLPNGGFVIVSVTTGSTLQSRTFGASGTAVSAVQSFATWNRSYYQPPVAVYPDSSFSIASITTSTIIIYNFSTTGTLGTSHTVVTDAYNSGLACIDLTALSNGNALLAYANTSNQLYLGQYTSSTGAWVGSGNYASNTQTTGSVKGLSGGGFAVFSGSGGSALQGFYSVRSNTYSTITNATINGVCANLQTTQNATILEGSTYITLVITSVGNNGPTGTPVAIQFLKASPYTQRSLSSLTFTAANLSATVNSYARSNSTPNAASFLATTTQTLSTTIPVSSGTNFALTPYTPSGADNINTSSAATMLNGQFVVAYAVNGGGVRYCVFNPDGTLVQTVVVSATANVSSTPVGLVCLGNGKLVVAYASSSTQIDFFVYSTSYALLVSGNTSGVTYPPNSVASSNYSLSLSALETDKFLIGWLDASAYPAAAIWNDAGTKLFDLRDTTFSGNQSARWAGNQNGQISCLFYVPASVYYYKSDFVRYNSTYSFAGASSLSSFNTQSITQQALMTPNGVFVSSPANGASNRLSMIACQGPTNVNIGYGTSASNTAQNIAMCIGSANEIMVLLLESGTKNYYLYSPASTLNVVGSSQPANYLNNSISVDNNTSGSTPSITCIYKDTFAFAYKTTSNALKVGIISTASRTYSQAITANVTASNTALIPSQSNGYYLAGVSASACSAGGTGVIQTNGSATLSADYPAATVSQSFDFTSPTVPVGIKGTIAGRNLTLQGG